MAAAKAADWILQASISAGHRPGAGLVSEAGVPVLPLQGTRAALGPHVAAVFLAGPGVAGGGEAGEVGGGAVDDGVGQVGQPQERSRA